MQIDSNLGAIYTPASFASYLTNWAIDKSNVTVLDLGVGSGNFVFEAYKRLCEIGTDASVAQNLIYGSEIDPSAFMEFQKKASSLGLFFPNILSSNFFSFELPYIDSIIGNPPYVRRSNMSETSSIRQRVLEKNKGINENHLRGLTDLYVYFLLYSLPALKLDGKLAVIIADSWLNVGYGEELKRYLQQNFAIEQLISLDRRVFEDAQVKPVLLLARKTSHKDNWKTNFIRIHNGLPIDKLKDIVGNSGSHKDVTQIQVLQDNLKPSEPWGIHFKAPEIYELISNHSFTSPIESIAVTRIGHQTLAKEFFVIPAEGKSESKIEDKYLEPLAQSLKYFDKPFIEIDDKPTHFVFYCSENKDELCNTGALDHILKGEARVIGIRGKDIQVVGYNSKERIIQSSRKNWYDLKTRIEIRGRAEILLPRLIYHNFWVLWNKARWVPGELFIEFIPKENYKIELFLAILNSTITEIMFRAHAQVYGGGTYNMNPSEIKSVPILNPSLISSYYRSKLISAYETFVRDTNQGRNEIDETMYKILGFDKNTRQIIADVLKDLHLISTSTKLSSE